MISFTDDAAIIPTSESPVQHANDNSNCSWLITVTAGYVIQFVLVYLNFYKIQGISFSFDVSVEGALGGTLRIYDSPIINSSAMIAEFPTNAQKKLTSFLSTSNVAVVDYDFISTNINWRVYYRKGKPMLFQ